MKDDVYQKLCAEMARRGGRYPGKDIPEFYTLAEELFTPEEAAVAALMTSRIIALSQPKPGHVLTSGYQPQIDSENCTSCEICLTRCPAKALRLTGDSISVDLDRCFGCGVCAVGCPAEAMAMVEKKEVHAVPVNRKALEKAIGSRL